MTNTETARSVEAKRTKKTVWKVAIVAVVEVVLSMPVSVVSVLQFATTDLCRRRQYT